LEEWNTMVKAADIVLGNLSDGISSRDSLYAIENARLKTELAKYTSPLTADQRKMVAKEMRVGDNENLSRWDAAMRRARGK